MQQIVMQQISAMHPAWAELSPAELPSAELPLAGRLREWTAAWRRGEALGQRIARDLVFTSLLDVLPCSGSQRALAGASGRGLRALSYARLHEFVSDGAPFREVDLRPGDRCAIAMPEGPDLAVCLLTISMRCTVVPMNPWNPEGEIAADLAETGANAVIVPLGEDFGHIRRAARECGAAVINLVSHGEEAGLFDLVLRDTERRRLVFDGKAPPPLQRPGRHRPGTVHVRNFWTQEARAHPPRRPVRGRGMHRRGVGAGAG